DVDTAELVFYASTPDGAFTDATRPVVGIGDDKLLPVYRYTAPEIAGTGGTLRESGSRIERIVLPQRFAADDATITLQLDQSLASAALAGLEYLDVYPYESTEVTISRLLPNVVTARALTQLGVDDPVLQAKLDATINLALQRLAARQKPDGGWGWYTQDESSVLVTAYALVGLVEAQASNYAVDQSLIDGAVRFLQPQVSTRDVFGGQMGIYIRDRQVFVLYALALAGQPDTAALANLYEQRDLLSLYSRALLALALPATDTVRINALLDDIFAQAIVSANGTHWEEAGRDRFGWGSNTRTTAMILRALVKYRPDNDLVPNVVRWLMTARRGDAWETTQETAWSVLALTDWMVATNELNPGYSYAASANGSTLTEGVASRADALTSQVFELDAEATTTLDINRSEGEGVLYYTAYLEALLPVPDIMPLTQGVSISREYTLPDSDTAVTQAQVGDIVQVHLTIIAPNDLYFVVVDDPLPAGTEGIDPGLATSERVGTRPGLALNDPLSQGWGWWWFSNIEFRDERVVLNASYLPAGTYEYVYALRVSVPGVYNVIPPTVREFYFPEVSGRGAGSTFT
ncbi:MAG: alpha-2-macroglobulin, partial [Armatimonadetes bacterium]|nr:alpha-2-macroglobulin [Anaerolineae bacterium]